MREISYFESFIDQQDSGLMLHQQLKEYTTPAHQALEKNMVAKIRRIQSNEDYTRFLKMMYGYYASLEALLADHLHENYELGFEKRRKANWILNDIEKLGGNTQAPLCNELPCIQSYPSALGAMYVLEGSVLGGKIIAKMIAGQVGMDNDESLSFFKGYGDETPRMWASFKQNLDKPFDETQESEIISSANDTFITFKNWIDRHA